MKRSLLMCGPLTSRSGYGAHARDIFHAFYNTQKYDIKVLDVRWGDCPRNALDPTSEKDMIIKSSILHEPKLDTQPDIYVDVRIPNEFQTFGKFNIGITAGIETTAISQKWVEGCNKMDLVIVPSEHCKTVFKNTVFEEVHDLPDGGKQKVGEHTVTTPIEVLFEGSDENIYKPLKIDEIDNYDIFNNINKLVGEKFAFLFVGMWGSGGYGEDRKDIGTMIKTFYEAFANKKKKPALILKTNGATYSIIDHHATIDKIQHIKDMFPSNWELPNVYLLHGDLSDDEMNVLYNHPKIKAMVSFTHGEGFGRPLLEATMTGLPVIATGWSGHLDFLENDGKKTLLLSGTLQHIPESAHWKDILIPESQWFVVDEPKAYDALNHVFQNYYNEIKNYGENMMRRNRIKFNFNKMVELLDSIMSQYTDHLSVATQIKLPKLKKVQGSLPDIKLPKLKKVT